MLIKKDSSEIHQHIPEAQVPPLAGEMFLNAAEGAFKNEGVGHRRRPPGMKTQCPRTRRIRPARSGNPCSAS